MLGLLLGPCLESVSILLSFKYHCDEFGLGNQVRIVVSDALSLRGKEVDASKSDSLSDSRDWCLHVLASSHGKEEGSDDQVGSMVLRLVEYCLVGIVNDMS